MKSDGWFWNSIFAMLCVVPAWLMIPFMKKNFGMKSEIILFWYCLAMALGCAVIFGATKKIVFSGLVPSWGTAIILVTGVTFGALANALLFGAVVEAPNPALPPVILSTGQILVFSIALVLGRTLPKYFNEVKLDIYHLTGALLMLVGLFVVAWKRSV